MVLMPVRVARIGTIMFGIPIGTLAPALLVSIKIITLVKLMGLAVGTRTIVSLFVLRNANKILGP